MLGSTGENGLLSSEERSAVAAHAIERWGTELHVMVGVPAMGLKDACVDAVGYAALGAGSLLVPANYGFALSPAELDEYYRESPPPPAARRSCSTTFRLAWASTSTPRWSISTRPRRP